MKSLALITVVVATACALHAQIWPPDPIDLDGTVVTIAVTDGEASEIPEVPPGMERPQLFDPAVFVVTRQGPTNNPLNVYYTVHGSASNGVDYARLSGRVEIPAGAFSAQIVVEVIDDSLVEGTEDVAIRIELPICAMIVPPPPGCYRVGFAGGAIARIYDDDSKPTDNLPPSVRITSPTNGTVFRAPATVHIEAVTVDRDGYAPNVEFFAGTNKIGEAHVDFIQAPPPGQPIELSFDWANVPPGQYALTARAIDDRGAAAKSEPVFIGVIGSQPVRTVVEIFAPDPDAAEQSPLVDSLPNNGRFVVERHGPTNFPLTVYYSVSGTAENGVDYENLPGRIVIPEGQRTADIAVNVIDDEAVEGTERVIVTLQPPICIAIYPPPPECYEVGIHSQATVSIRDNDSSPTNIPPTVRITAPPVGARFSAPARFSIQATTVDPDGYTDNIVFYANGAKIGEERVFFFRAPDDGEPIRFSMVWSNVPAGAYELTASTVDHDGVTATSPPVHVQVVASNAPPSLPTVTIVASDAYASEGGWNWIRTTPLGVTDTNATGDVWWITDWHTNTATFVIRRSGETNSDLTVFYSVGGTASNSVDYLGLSGRVTIAAGERAARLTIRPQDDTLREGPESIVLRLQPGPTMVQLYAIGHPDSAAAILADNDGKRPPCVRLPDGLFHVCLPALSGGCYSIQGSSDLRAWSSLGACVVTDGAMHYVDVDAPGTQRRFYRLVPEPLSASEY